MRSTRGGRWFVLGVATVAAGLVVAVAGAATNIVPNPGFENGGATPDGWSAGQGTVTRDTATFHTGAASLALSGSGLNNPHSLSDCVVIAEGAGSQHAVSFWYETTDADITGLGLEVDWYSDASCSFGSLITSGVVEATPTLGGWHQLSDTFNSPSGVQSIRFDLFVTCAFCSQTLSANFDDVDYESAALAVQLSSFAAARTAKGVLVRWRTGIEAETLGFHVYRSHGAKWTRVDRRLIPAKGSVAGARYSLLDRRAPQGTLRYRLQAVGTDGSRTWYGGARVVGR